MKRLLLAFTSIFFLHFAQAQNLTAQQDTATGSGASSDEITIFNHFNNNSGAARTFTWTRNEVSLPTGWLTTVCDTNNCFGVTTGTHTITFPIANNHTSPISVNFFPYGVAGTGVVKINYFYPGDTTSAVFIATADAVSGISKVSTVKDIFMYPTPAKDNLTVVFAPNLMPNRIELYNVLGQKAKIIPVQLERNSVKTIIDVSDIDKGLYFLRVYSSNSSTVITKQFTKE